MNDAEGKCQEALLAIGVDLTSFVSTFPEHSDQAQTRWWTQGQCCVLLALLTPDESVSLECHFGKSYNLRTNRSRLLVQSLAKLVCLNSTEFLVSGNFQNLII